MIKDKSKAVRSVMEILTSKEKEVVAYDGE